MMRDLVKRINIGFLMLFVCTGFLWAGDGQIDIAYLPFTISQSGSYVVVANLTLSTTNTNGITISADNVTLDLNGHTLKGPGNTTGSFGSCIDFNSYSYNVVIRNGIIQNWRGSGIDGFEIGVRGANNCNIESLQCYYNGENGIYVSFNCIIKDNICLYNGKIGIFTRDASLITNNVCKGNTLQGISANSSSCITGNTCSSNGGTGISVVNGNTVELNTCSFNTGTGIEIYGGNLVINNNCYYNGYMTGNGAGINVGDYGTQNCIENNLVSMNDRGIDCNPATNNYIAGNRANGNTTDYDFAAGNTYGLIVDGTGGGSIATSNHFANIRF